jgi:hypothetical protein
MKKKGPRDIPDFSTKRKSAPVAGTPVPKVAGVTPPPVRTAKPQMPTTKSGGRRGA